MVTNSSWAYLPTPQPSPEHKGLLGMQYYKTRKTQQSASAMPTETLQIDGPWLTFHRHGRTDQPTKSEMSKTILGNGGWRVDEWLMHEVRQKAMGWCSSGAGTWLNWLLISPFHTTSPWCSPGCQLVEARTAAGIPSCSTTIRQVWYCFLIPVV